MRILSHALRPFGRFEPKLVHFHPRPGALVPCRAGSCLAAELGTPRFGAQGDMLQHLGTLQKSHTIQIEQFLLSFPKYLICTL